jgi:hypothetical protein
MKDCHKHFTATVWKEDDWYIAQCLDVDVASQGKSEEQAIDNLREALELYFSPPYAGTVPNVPPVLDAKGSMVWFSL